MTFGSRTLLAICIVLVVLLGALAAVQYRWSTRIAAADAQREKEHLDSAASLFANRFNDLIAETTGYLQNEAWAALNSGERLENTPKLVAELYFLNIPENGAAQVRRLAGNGRFETASRPEWISFSRCGSMAIQQPPALVAPIFRVVAFQDRGDDEIKVRRTVNGVGCFVARIDTAYLRQTLFPQLIRDSFGATAAAEYNFAVVKRIPPYDILYGSRARADLKRAFFAIDPGRLPFPKAAAPLPAPRPNAVFIQHMESTIVTKNGSTLADLFGPGIWELDVAHKGLPLAASFEQTRRRNMLLSIGVEALLIAAIAFLVIATRRMQQLANQKMQFVASVSHELRTPVSALTILSRNQADGLVVGAEKVKQYGELMHQQTRRLNEMVEQTLLYAGIHSGLRRPARDQVDLLCLIEEAVDARRDELERAGFHVEMALSPDLPGVSGDAKLLRTAIDNLLSNAQKHAESGHWIRVSAVHGAAEKEIRIGVEDRGAGIDPASREEIFEPFCRGPAAVDAQIPGSGLGLSLVRSAVEAHRGAVTCTSEPGRGSTFTLHLPL